MAHTIVMVRIPQGHSGYDHLIDSNDEKRVQRTVGTKHRTYAMADRAACDAFNSGCDRRLVGIPIKIATCDARGNYHGPLAVEAGLAAQRKRESSYCRKCRAYIHPTDPAACPNGDSWDPDHNCDK